MPKRTIGVLPLLTWANENLSRTDEFATIDFKSGICCMIEMVLHETGNYEGFCFQDNNDSSYGTLGHYSRSYFYSEMMRKESRNLFQKSEEAESQKVKQGIEEEMAGEADDYDPEVEWYMSDILNDSTSANSNKVKNNEGK